MSKKFGTRRPVASSLTYGLSKPSKQSLIARGLAANEKKAEQRLQGKKAEVPARIKPTCVFYNSSDSDADQVYSVNKRLDRCSSLLKSIMEANANKGKTAKTPVMKKQKNEVKKSVKIVLPSAEKAPAPSAQLKKTMSSQKVLTSTPNLKKNVKTKRMREDELKAEIAKMELEKTLLKEQYTSLLQHHLTPQSKIKRAPRKTVGHQLTPQPNANGGELSAISDEDPIRSASLRFEASDTTSRTAGSVFKELERTIGAISEKLSFPGSLTPSRNQSSTKNVGEYSSSAQRTPNLVEPNDGEDLSRPTTSLLGRIFPTNQSWLLNQSGSSTKGEGAKYSLYSYDSLVEGPYPASLSASEGDSTLIADNDQGVENLRPSSDESDVRSNSEAAGKEKSLIYAPNEGDDKECINEDGFDGGNQEKELVKTVRFQGSVLLNSDNEEASPCNENDEITDLDSDVEASFAEEGIDGTGEVFEKAKATEEPMIALKTGYNYKDENMNNIAIEEGNKEKKDKKTKAKKFRRNLGNVKSNTDAGNENVSEKAAKKKDFYESPNKLESKRILDVVSQLSKMNEAESSQESKQDERKGGDSGGGINPGHAAAQITALSYLFKELMNVLSSRISSEETRLLVEIDHMIGLLPFLIDNLHPDLQTEVNLAVQPLRVENSDVRRQLRIANQKIRDFQVNVQALEKSLKDAKKRAIDETQLKQLGLQIDRDEAERDSLKEIVAELNKTVDELRKENQKLIESISGKDAEIVKQKQSWQKEKNFIYTDNDAAKTKLESLSLALQAQEKQNKILKLSLSQSEAEIVRVKDLNRDLRQSVARLLQDVNFQDQPRFDLQKGLLNANHPEKIVVKDTTSFPLNREDKGGDVLGDSSRAMESRIEKDARFTKSNANKNTMFRNYPNVQPQIDWTERLKTHRSSSVTSDQNSDVLSSSSVSDSTKKDDEISSVGHDSNFDDQFSTLTCDSGEFRSDLADLSSNIRRMQQSLFNAKRK